MLGKGGGAGGLKMLHKEQERNIEENREGDKGTKGVKDGDIKKSFSPTSSTRMC